MKQKMIGYIVAVLLLVIPQLSFAQYFQALYDNDSTVDWGWCIASRPDSNYFIVGWSQNETTGQFSTFDMVISNDGSHVLSKYDFKINGGTLGPGDPGQIKSLSTGGHVLPLLYQWPDSATSYLYSAAGIMKLNSSGDTVLLKTYTDTSIYFDILYAINVMQDGGYIAGGARGLNIPSKYPGYLIRTDSIGDTLWTHTYQKDTAQWVTINTVAPLNNGQILVGAMSTYQIIYGTYTYNHNAPWFMVLDSMGNILKDTLYSNGYVGGGAIYKDLNGGYVHIGEFDSLYTSNPSDIENFPGYIAHLDSDFRITWITPFSYSYTDGHRDRVILRQLQDSSYIVIGAAFTNYAPNSFGWAAKVDRNGNILWDHYYVSDSTHEAYFRDVVEMPNGNLVFVGATFNDTLPAWHSLQDMWIVGVDSNGCEIPGCTTTRVNNVPTINTFIQIYPNPTYGNFTIKAPQAGELAVYNIQSQQVAVYKVNAGETNLKLPSTINPGVYVCRYVAEQRDSLPVVIRLLYEP